MVMSYGARTGTPVVLPIVEAMKSGGLFNLKTSTGNQIFASFTRTLYEWRQDGDCVDINVKATLTAAWTGSGTHIELEIPTTDFTFAAGIDTIEGSVRAYDGSTYTTLGFVALTVAGNRIRFLPMQQTDAAQNGSVRNQNDYAAAVPFTWASGCVLFISIRGLKCSGFAGMSTQSYNAGVSATQPSLVPGGVENATHITNWSGPFAATAGNIPYQRENKKVTLLIPTVRPNGNNVSGVSIVSSVALPASLRPSSNLVFPVFVTSGGVDQTVMGLATLAPTGIFTIFRDAVTPGFSASTSIIGFYANSITYLVP